MNLKEGKEGYIWESLEEGKGKGKWYNYIIISKYGRINFENFF